MTHKKLFLLEEVIFGLGGRSCRGRDAASDWQLGIPARKADCLYKINSWAASPTNRPPPTPGWHPSLLFNTHSCHRSWALYVCCSTTVLIYFQECLVQTCFGLAFLQIWTDFGYFFFHYHLQFLKFNTYFIQKHEISTFSNNHLQNRVWKPRSSKYLLKLPTNNF